MLPELIPQGKMHSIVKRLFSPETLPKVKLAGTSQHFWKKLPENKKKIYKVTKSHFTWIESRLGSSQSKNECRSIRFRAIKN